MPAFRHSFVTHHVYQLLIPANYFGLYRRRLVILFDKGLPNLVDIQSVGTDQVLHLPHVKQIFDHIFLSFLLSHYHSGHKSSNFRTNVNCKQAI